MPALSVSIEGLEELQSRFSGSGDAIRRHFTAAINKAAVLVQQQARIEAPVDQGQLRQGIAVAPVNGLVGGVIARAPYSFWVHEGRKPGKMPPVSVLEAWAARHGMPGAGYAIARKIAAKGTKPNPFMARAVETVSSRLPGLWSEAANAVLKEIA